MIDANKHLFVAVALAMLLVLFAIWNEFRHTEDWEAVKRDRGCRVTRTTPARDLIYDDHLGRHVRVVPAQTTWTCLDGTEWTK